MGEITSTELAVPAADLWALLVDPYAAGTWTDGTFDPRPGGACTIADRGGAAWPGRVTEIVDGSSLVVRLAAPPGHDHLDAGTFEIRVDAVDEGHSRLTVVCVGDDDRIDLVWGAVIARVERMARKVRRGREPQQAVVVIHGIGEQRPGDTLRRLVESAAGEDRGLSWSRPDHASDSYELRRLTLFEAGRRPRTDFYEYYWAHQIRDTTLGDVTAWAWSIMGRLPWRVPARLRAGWVILWGLVLAVGVLAASLATASGAATLASSIVAVVLGGALAVLNNTVGDAARYLSPRPNNVAHRQAIREGGVELLRKLHDSGHYQRIVLVGHSLGSVIAYDIVTHLWQEMNRPHLRPEEPGFGRIAAAESPKPADVGRSLQGAVWREARRNTHPWLITDLVTLGSPLAHAALLMARNADEFAAKKASSEFPTAPPLPNEAPGPGRFSFNQPYRTRSGVTRSFTYLKHGAPFAAVRWTNLYFPAKWGLFGDIVGGPVAPVFGDWICDVPLTSHLPWWKRNTPLAHTQYWRPAKQSADAQPAAGSFCDRLAEMTDHIQVLRHALTLGMADRLRSEAAKHDPVMYL